MSLVTIVWSSIAAACLTLAAVHGMVWLRNREALGTLAFTLAAISTAGLAYCELTMLKAPTPTVFVTAQRWIHVPILFLMVALAGFVYQYLDGGRRWLAIAAIGVRLVSLVINFTVGQSLNLLEVTSLHRIPLLGEDVSFGVGPMNPWQAVGQLSIVLLTAFFVDATVSAWRKGRRAAALYVGGSLTFLTLAGLVHVLYVYWSGGETPSTISLFALGVVAIMGYALGADLLRTKSLLKELREREDEASLATEAANLGVWTRDIVGDTIWANDTWRELFGFAPGETLSAENVLARVHAEDRPAFAHGLVQDAKERGDYHSEVRLVLPDGRMRWIAVLGRVQFDAKGRALRSRGACLDITARKHAEQEMLQLRQDIAHVGRVSVMGQLASTLAHEINQPLSAILRNAEAASLFLQDPSPDLDEIRAILIDIRNDDQRAGAVIDRMRTLLRRQEVAMARVDVAQLLGDVAMFLRPDAVARHVALQMLVPAELPAVRGDRVQLQQVLLNLVLNGMDALEGLDDRNRSVAVTARRVASDAVEISVTDSGRGIAADQLGRVFDPFYTTKVNGIGMGLSISRSIVETHGGVLSVASNPAGGASFRFSLQIADASRDAS